MTFILNQRKWGEEEELGGEKVEENEMKEEEGGEHWRREGDHKNVI